MRKYALSFSAILLISACARSDDLSVEFVDSSKISDKVEINFKIGKDLARFLRREDFFSAAYVTIESERLGGDYSLAPQVDFVSGGTGEPEVMKLTLACPLLSSRIREGSVETKNLEKIEDGFAIVRWRPYFYVGPKGEERAVIPQEISC